jgi:phosphoglycolate phosphatase-like HAD superfamily hydrolase
LYDKRGFVFRLISADPLQALRMLAEHQTRNEMKGLDFYTADAFYEEFFTRFSLRICKPAQVLRNWFFTRYMPLMCDVLKKHFSARCSAIPLFNKLKCTGIPFAIYSDYPFTVQRMTAIGLSPELCGIENSLVFGQDNFGALKPSARPFLCIAHALGTQPENVLVAGDRDSTDGEGARRAGMRFLLIE